MTAAAEPVFPAWALMWTLAPAIFAAFKWMAWASAPAASARASRGRNLGLLLAWPGTDATAFLGGRVATPPGPAEWLAAAVKTLLGFFSVSYLGLVVWRLA